MDELQKISADELKDISARTGFNLSFLVKDYYLTLLLYLLKDINGLYFKGGTALQKVVFDHLRLSEDVDFTVTTKIKALKKTIEQKIDESTLFGNMTTGKQVNDFVRIVVSYDDPFGSEGAIFIDLNKRAKLLLEPEEGVVKNFYHLDFTIPILNKRELVAEKIHALIHRNQPRDYFDVYHIIKKGLPIDMGIVQRKSAVHDLNILIGMIFRKANKIHARWNEDLAPLVKKHVSFRTVITMLKNFFQYNTRPQ